ncbi:MAG TPA: type IV pili methyl-accepting chemotaxis transducer N-terminal domain-containing protein [Ramlibacter sp.]|nr:type IV pili methyl-accepting chemotaxis transducer N-terminal domain-containing protein [Ramlibacter sp.]
MTPSIGRRTAIRAAALALAVPYVYSANAEIAVSTAINRSGRLRALSQRCAKAYGQELLGVLPEHAREIALTCLRLIAVNLDELNKGGAPTEVARLVQQAATAAGGLRTLMGRERTRDGLLAVSRQADVLLDSAEQATSAYEALGKSGSAKLVNLCGRQRMLSQRMTKNYFLLAAGHQAKATREQIEADRAAFAQALHQLNAAPLSTSGIRNELVLAQSQWLFFEAALGKPADAESLRNVATTSERLLETMNNLTELYDGALKDLLGKT